MAIELRMDANREAVTRHQQRRIAQGQAVGQQLLEGRVQILARCVVLPRKVIALGHIGIPACLAQHQGVLLKNVFAFATCCAAWRGHTQQRAQIHEVRLRALAFVEVKRRAAGAPFGDE